MAEPTLNYVTCADTHGPRHMAYWEWGAADASHTVVCVHGLSRQGRDFDVLAQALLARCAHPLRIVCPDVAGRGKSDWLQNPAAYALPTYAADMGALLTQLKPTTLDWVGTSLGGLIGLVVAAHAQTMGVAVRKLVLNDVGPVIQWASLQRIGTYLGREERFDHVQQAADALWAISRSFGPHTPAQWLELSRHMVKTLPDGTLGLHYDPAIALAFRAVTEALAAAGQAQLWQWYDGISADTLLLRGADSDVLSADTAQAMTLRGPRARWVEFAGVGHAPTLIAHDQLDTVCSFLEG
jgi:pimeloyl-ACP methyl ester carboxylesterase